MAEATNVGAVYMDLIVRDTLEKQIRAMSSKAESYVQKVASDLENAVSQSVSHAAAHSRQASADVERSFTGAFSKSVAIAQSKLNALERELEKVNIGLDAAFAAGRSPTNSQEISALAAEQEILIEKIAQAQERLSIEMKAAAVKQAAAQEAAARKAEAAAQKSAEKRRQAEAKLAAQQEALARRTALAQEREAQKAELAKEKAAQRAALEEEKVAQRAAVSQERAAEQARAKWKRAFSAIGNGIVTPISAATARIKSLFQKSFRSAERSASRFGTRLKSIVSGALVFNTISMGLRKVTTYFATAIKQTDEMKNALSNLKGAASTATTPLIQMLAPALASIANMAAVAFSYLSKLISYFTGQSVAAMAAAAKKINQTAKQAEKAKASVASFDQIEKVGDSETSTEPNYAFTGQSDFLGSITDAIQNGDWSGAATLLTEKLNAMWRSIDWAAAGDKLAKGLNCILLFLATVITTFDWLGLGSNLGIGINSVISGVDWGNLGVILGAKFSILTATLGGLFSTVDWAGLGSAFADGFSGLWESIDWTQAAKTLSDGTIGVLTTLGTSIAEIDWQQIGNDVADFLAAIDWYGIIAALINGIGAATAGLGLLLWGLIEDAWNSMVDWWYDTAYEDGQFTIDGLLWGIDRAIRNIGTWIDDHIFKPFMDGFKSVFGIHSPSKVMSEQGSFLISGLFSGLQESWSQITGFFGTALSKLKTTLSSGFNSVKDTVLSIWKAIANSLKTTINSIIGFINGLISGMVSGLNSVISAMNKLSFDVPDWVPGLGGKTFGFNIGTITAPQIPMLANGGAIRQPTLAMMGEYAGARSNPEIAAPQSLIKDALAQATQEGMDTIISILREILEAILGISIGDDVIAEAVSRYQRKQAIMNGG